ncbi:MAG: amidase [Candidatus Binatia bacterium]
MKRALSSPSLSHPPHDLCVMSIGELGAALRSRELSAEAIITAYLARIEQLASVLNAFISIDWEGARAAAKKVDHERSQGIDRGPLHGIPIAVKDCFATKNQLTTAGSRILADYVTDEDAEAVRRLRAAGAVMVGKTNMNEFAFGVTGINPHYGTVRNPWDPDRIVGGSSSGSAAAVAAAMSAAAIGTDTGGSIRIPASLTGIVGFKPTYDMIPRHGVVPLSWSLDHVGICCRTVADTRMVFECLVEYPPAYRPEQGSLRGLKLGVLADHCEDLTAEVANVWEGFLREAERVGAEIVPVRLKQVTEVMAASTAIMFSEAAAVHGEWLRTRRDLYDPQVKTRLLQGALIPATTYLQAQQIRRRLIEQNTELFTQVDLLACPTQPDVACRISAVSQEIVRHMLRNTRLAPLLGMPALSMPLRATGLPVGLQLIGPAGQDQRLLSIAAALEEAFFTKENSYAE